MRLCIINNISVILKIGVDFYSVAIHEMGHSLGLGHSSEPNSIMNPYYKGPQPQDIGYDDILGMHSLYSKKFIFSILLYYFVFTNLNS